MTNGGFPASVGTADATAEGAPDDLVAEAYAYCSYTVLAEKGLSEVHETEDPGGVVETVMAFPASVWPSSSIPAEFVVGHIACMCTKWS